MANTEEVTYTQLDTNTRLGMVRSRIRELETSHQTLRLRIDLPAPGEQITENDRENLQMLTSSLEGLYKLEQQLSSDLEKS